MEFLRSNKQINGRTNLVSTKLYYTYSKNDQVLDTFFSVFGISCSSLIRSGPMRCHFNGNSIFYNENLNASQSNVENFGKIKKKKTFEKCLEILI